LSFAFLFCPFLRGLGRLGTLPELRLLPSKLFRPLKVDWSASIAFTVESGHEVDSVLRCLPVMFIAIVAAAPSLVLLTYFYLRDRYEREPLGHLVVAYLLGMFAMLAAQSMVGLITDGVSAEWLHLGGEPARIFDAFVLAGVVEEFAKWAMLMTAVYTWREFDETLDGLLYGVTVSLGFATLENLLFLSHRGLDIAWKRAIFAVPAHALFGGCMGFYVGRAKFAPVGAGHTRRFGFALALSLLVPIAFHGAYDFALLHGLDWKVWVAVTLLSLTFWVFVLRRVRHAQRASPFRPKTMMPSDFSALHRKK
jgi:RsiW-degrading membrane proteinase PrsW (M82 family)